MEKFKRLYRMTIAFGVITIISLLFSAFALHDIYYNKEPDLTLEWNIVKLSFIFIVIFIGLSISTIAAKIKQDER
ncbi:MAG: hypothetical protein R3A12_03715 [Ignavibacteria bacterium]|nr:hypothetical protein [Ignavibacteriota bacterium]